MRPTISIALLCSFAALALAEGDPRAGRAAYSVCAGCHGFRGEGNPALRAPRLAGLEDWDLARQLDNFRRGVRGYAEQDRYGVQMATMALAVADARGAEDLVAHIAELPPLELPATRHDGRTQTAGDAARGRDGYALCASCHGAAGEGNRSLEAPRLAGLEDWYVVAQLEAFKTGLRGAHPDDAFGPQMRGIAALLDGQQMRDVAAHIATF